MYINSPGGAVTAGLAIYDTMQYIRFPINTICMGQAASMGSLLLVAGVKGKRRSLPNATIMIHQPSGGYSGQAKDMTIHTKQSVRVWDALNALYSKHTGRSVDVIQKIMDRDYFMTLEEAKEFGIIDEVIDQRRYCNYLLSLLLNHHQRRAIQQVHSQLITTNSISHNLINFLLRQYSLSDFPQDAFSLYRHIQHQNQPFFFDSFSFSFLIKSCANSQDSTTGSLIHSLTTKSGFGIHVYVQTALVNMYVACGSLGEAKKVFEEMPSRNSVTWNVLITGLMKWGEISQARALFDVMPDKNVVSWTGIIDGYARMNQADEALSLFRRMMHEGIKHSVLTMLVIFPAIWNIGCLELCQSIHAYGEKSGFNMSDIRVTNSLIDAYAKCGSVESALKFFECISEERKNLVSWTSIISGCAMYGMTKEAVDNFEEMKNVGFKPNRIAFVSILNACSHGGLVDEGLEFFRNMVNECGIVPDIKHYGCLVDMLGRAGRLEEAENMVMDIPTEMVTDVIWRTLLGACSFHGNAEMGERVLGKILKMERESAGDYVLLSNIFIGVGRYADSERVRKVMDERNASKVPGLSLI